MVIAFAVVIALAFLVGGPILVYCNQTFPDLRTSIVLGKDLFIGLFSVAGIFLAVENLRRTAHAARTAVALRLVEKWNTTTWDKWHDLRKELFGKPAPDVVNTITDEHEETVAIVLNCLEEIAAAINSKSADDHQVWRSVGPTVVEYYNVLQPWVLHYRKLHSRPHAWAEIEDLTMRWSKSPRR